VAAIFPANAPMPSVRKAPAVAGNCGVLLPPKINVPCRVQRKGDTSRRDGDGAVVRAAGTNILRTSDGT